MAPMYAEAGGFTYGNLRSRDAGGILLGSERNRWNGFAKNGFTVFATLWQIPNHSALQSR